MADHHEYCAGGFSPDDIVITGIAGRFPECGSIEDLKEALLTQRELLIPSNLRYEKGACDLPFSSTGTIMDADKFDAEFFGFPSKIANATDPLQRKILEVSYEAICDSGYDPICDLKGANIGVYTAVSNEDGKAIIYEQKANCANFATGYLRAMLSSRCSYFFDFHGRSYTMDTACSSSLVALNNAVEDIREGKVEAALVNSGELCLSPEVTKNYVTSGIVSITNESNPFDARANGIVRCEAVVAFFVQRASHARRAYATVMDIKHVATGYVPEGVYVPCEKEEVKLFKTILKGAGLTPADIQYVECHGTGTQVGDPIEIRSVESAYCQGRDTPLYVGSVKSNLGHSEAASGQTGALKALLALETGVVAPNRGFQKPNENCEALIKGTVQVLKDPLPLTTPYILVNSFGFGGSLVQAALKRNQIDYQSHHFPEDLPRLVLYSATTEDGVRYIFDYVQNHGELREEFFALLNKLAFTPSLLKPYRGYLLMNKERSFKEVKSTLRHSPREVWFVMTGMGCQWPGMGLQMMQIKLFAESMRRSAAVLKPLGMDLFELLRKDSNHLTTDRSIVPAFVTIAAIQIALVDVLRALEIHPDGIIGHSVGELLCAYADGCCTAEETILSAYWRGKSVETADLENGAMAAVGMSWEAATKRCPAGVYPACHNADDSVTISGKKNAVEKFVAELQAENIFARIVNAYGYAFHCEKVWPAAQTLRVALAEVIRDPKPRTNRWISSSYPENEWGKNDCKMAGPEYFVHNLMSVVRFNDVMRRIPSDAITIEIGPHSLLQSLLKRTMSTEATHFGLMKRNEENNVTFFLETLGKLYAQGLNPKIEKLYRPVKFPVPRGTPIISDLIKWNHSETWDMPRWSSSTSSLKLTYHLESTDRFLLDHFIDGRPLFPATGLVCTVWYVLAHRLNKKMEDINVTIEDFRIHRATVLNISRDVSLEVNILASGGRFEITENDSLVATGRVFEEKNMKFCEPSPEVNRESCTFIPGEDLYNELRICGYEYGPAFRNLAEVDFNGSEGIVNWKEEWVTFLDTLLLFFMFSEKQNKFMLPTGALSFKICPDILLKYVEEIRKKNISGIPVNFHHSSKICRSVGVEIRSLDVDYAPQHVTPDVCMYEEYRFVPYMYTYSPPSKNQDHLKYMLACNKVIDMLGMKMNKNFGSGKFRVEPRFDFDIEDYLKNSKKESGLLFQLKELVDNRDEFASPEQVQTIFGSLLQNISKDYLNTLLLDEHPLRLVFDIIFENTFKKFSVLEIQNSSVVILPYLIETAKKFSMLNFKKKSLVCKNEDDVDKEKINDCNIELHPYSILPSIAQEKSQGVLISTLCTTSKEEARKHIQLLSSTVEKKGFILLLHKTCILPPEHLIATLSGQRITIVSQADLESLFKEEKLLVVTKISDSGCSCLYLLRHSSEPSQRKLINISKNASWFDDLKSSVREGSHTTWIVAENCPDSGIIGMINCLRHESGGDRIRCVYIPCKDKENLPTFSFDEIFYQDVLKKDLAMNVYKEGSWGSFRHSQIEKEVQKSEVDNSFIDVKRVGDLSSLEWTESALNYLDIPKENIVEVYYSALNFKDVMLATGKISAKGLAEYDCDNALLGFEVAGRNKFGERVAGLSVSRGLGTTTALIPETIIKIPDHWSMEEAATVNVVYGTCYAALIIRGGMQEGERVLIHSGTGGIGQAAINIALSMKCEIFTTVGTQEKKNYLMKKFPSIKKENIGCSRNTSFENMIMKQTNGEGVDIVLNSLADDKFQASLRCLRKSGRFVEIGKYDILMNHNIGLKVFAQNITFCSVQVDQFLTDRNRSQVKRYHELLMDGISSGVVKPLDRTVFQADEVEKAFRFMASGTHIGKVLIKLRDEEKMKFCLPKALRLPAVPVTYFYARKVYIIVGGLGGFGIEVSKWLLSKGAKNLVLTSRYGARTPYHHFCLQRWKKEGFNVIVSTRNVSIKEEAGTLLKEVSKIGPVGGIFNSAVVLHDAFLENMDFQNFKDVCAPKAEATKHLDALSRCLCPELDHFVCFSSISCGRGNAGQMNYGYANSVMERICEQRRAAGLPGLAIQWGIIGDVGVVHRHMGDDAMIAGICAQRVKSCLRILDISCQLKHPVVCSYVMKNSASKSGDRGDVLQQLARIFGLKDPSEFNPMRSFGEMGLDSIIGVEMKSALETACDVTFTIQEIQEMKIDDLKELLEKAETRKKNASQSAVLLSTASVNMPKSFVQTEVLKRLNDLAKGTPLFILDMDGTDISHLRNVGQVLKYPSYSLHLTKDAPTTEVSSLAAWFLEKIRDVNNNKVHIVAHGTSSVVALEMLLQCQASTANRPRLIVLDGVHELLEAVNRETKQSEDEMLCSFVENYASSALYVVKEQLSKATNFEQKSRLVVDLFTKSCKESVDKTKLSNIITSHVHKIQLLQEYKPNGKLLSDLLVIEDSTKLLANDVAVVKDLLTEVCSGKITIHRIPEISKFSDESIKKLATLLNDEK